MFTRLVLIFYHSVILKNVKKPFMVILTLGCLFLFSCESKKWKKIKSIDLEGIHPIGLTYFKENIWVSDGDNNRLIKLTKEGKIENTIDFERPMHLSSDDSSIYIPEYISDRVIRLVNGKKIDLILQDSLDAPSAVDISGNNLVIADFYNHRILFFDGQNWFKFGKEGHNIGEFYYPTDVQFKNDKIYVADAYNNRVQVFDKTGQFLQVIGEKDNINAGTGLYVSDKEVFISDFENSRILIYNLKGELKQIIDQDLDKPIDLLLIGKYLYIANYKGKRFEVYSQ